MSRQISRRELIQNSALAGGLAALGGIFGAGEARASVSPNEKLNTAHIGVGGQGGGDLDAIGSLPNVNVVALCDVDDARAAGAYNAHPKAKKYYDFREMLEKEQKNIDAVVISTPDHCHAAATVMAMKLGKHVYCQKPLAHTVSEARVMLETARKQKVVTQMGTQAHPRYARTVELIQSGLIGPVREVHIVTDRPSTWWPQGQSRPATADPIPSTLKWDLWLGPAAARDYNKAYLPFVWRGWWDFGTGALGDMACHLMDGAWWALKLQYPTSVEAKTDAFTVDSPPLWSIITYEFPKRGEMPPVKVIWYDGKKLPPAELRENQPMENGSLFIGDKGKLLVEHTQAPKLLPLAQFEGVKEPDPYMPRYSNHYQQWVDACVNGGETGSNFEYACPLTEAVLLGNVAIRTGKRIEWDSRRLRAKNCPEADQYIKHHYRSGWSL